MDAPHIRARKSPNKITAQELRALLIYDPDTGIFAYRNGIKGRKAGLHAGCVNAQGYVRIKINYKQYRASRLAWLYMTGEWPECLIDHKNGTRNDDRFCNLREADCTQNSANVPKPNKLGFKGVRRYKARWQAVISGISLGIFSSPELAHAAYVEAAKGRYGEFHNPKTTTPNDDGEG